LNEPIEETKVEQRELEGRVALVTGASRNIGRAIAVALGTAGASVLVHAGRDAEAAEGTAELVREAGGKAAVFLSDMATQEGPGAAVQAALSAFGKLDIIVANAAIRPEASIDTVAFEEWRQVMAVCLDSAFLLSKAALPALRKSDQGAIVLIGGMTGTSGAAERIHVVAAKAGLTGFGKALAHDLGPDGITVNTVSPGLVATKREGPEPAHHASRTNPLGRRGEPEEIAAAVRMLAGPQARYITGQTLHVNGGALMA
jgi:3-oxoacyl-[acyl-carrier protein] reductase